MKIAKDILLNFISSMLVTFALHFLLYPTLSKEYGAEFFGMFLFIMASINMSSSIIGGSSNTIYFKYMNEIDDVYNKSMTFIWINIFIVNFFLIIVFLNEDISGLNILLITIICLMMSIRIYIVGLLRSKLDYKNIVINNILLSSLYIIISILIMNNNGLNVFFLLLMTEILYFLFFMIRYKDFDAFKLNFSIKGITKPLYIILLSMVLVNIIKYLDRFYLNITLGYEWIAYFFAAAIVGKVLNVPLSNISIVAFSYFIQPKFITKKLLIKLVTIIPVLSIFIILIGYLFGPFIIKLFYLEYYDVSIGIFYILNIGIGLTVIYEVLRGLIVKLYSENIKLYLEALTLLLCILILVVFNDVNSFYLLAIAITISYAFRSLAVVILLINKIKRGNFDQ